MPIEPHVRVAAWLHIAFGALWVCVLGFFGFVGLLFGAFGAIVGASVQGSASGVLALIAGFGGALFLFARNRNRTTAIA